jgi:hypothetical protein
MKLYYDLLFISFVILIFGIFEITVIIIQRKKVAKKLIKNIKKQKKEFHYGIKTR